MDNYIWYFIKVGFTLFHSIFLIYFLAKINVSNLSK